MKKRLLAMALAVIMAVSMLPMAASAAFTKRTTAPDKSNSYYYTNAKNPFYPSLEGQCTWYAWGRAYEITGKKPTWSTRGNADAWYGNAKNAGYATGTTPKVGSIACWDDWTHVAVVEEIKSNGNPVCSQANRQGNAFKYEEMTTKTVGNGKTVGLPDHYIYLLDGEDESSPVKAFSFDASLIYTISPACAPSRCLDIEGKSTENRANVQIWEKTGATNQQFQFVSVGDGYYKIVPQNSKKSLDCASQGTTAGTNVQQYDFSNNHNSQKWKLEDAGNGYCYIVPKGNTSLCLDVASGKDANGTNVQINTRNQSNAQKWKLTPANQSCNGNHTWGSWTTTKDPSCGVAGERKHTCTKCGQSATEAIAALTHSYGSWTTVTEATCTAAGKRERTCANCKNKESETIDALGHDYQLTGSTVLENTYTCSRCKDIKAIETGYSCDKDGHQWGRWETIEEPTCSSDGWRSRTCKVCGEVDEADLPATGKHNYVYDDETTYYIYYVCRDCGDLKLEEKEPEVADDSGMDKFIIKKHYFDGLFWDVTSGDWFNGNVATAYSMGLMNGRGSGTFAPRDNMTIAEVVTLAARVHSIYYTGSDSFPTYDGGNWYDPYVNYARDNGIISENYSFNRPATREQVVHILAKALPQAELANTVGSISFADSIDITYMADVRLLSGAGVINGFRENGSSYFKPLDPITRAQVAAIVGRMVQPSTRVGK